MSVEIERIKTKKTSWESCSLGLRYGQARVAMRFRSPFFVKQAGAANVGQGYVYDPVLEAANARYISGDITTEEVREEMPARLKRA
ncbi:hypothetical protein CN138_27405 [Sinorhizobium meliloti]|nr:hypothetical protein CN145_26695 [Sinorhizobium meliloti]RVL66867.1 hypothetical protein CN138_27405 [Sinorhizobium meliloti]RVL77096.1 hypothetical protein CN140_26875 [Sinorhizobium meliloti]RVN84073.1 hypothetical protein CN105_22990 [Sinorhizobium meliloti]RVO50958.1 hypothetical protein CN092_25670 [Sinorhizobium meliloti]